LSGFRSSALSARLSWFPPRCPPKELGAPSAPPSLGVCRLRRTLNEAPAPRTITALSIRTRRPRSRADALSSPKAVARLTLCKRRHHRSTGCRVIGRPEAPWVSGVSLLVISPVSQQHSYDDHDQHWHGDGQRCPCPPMRFVRHANHSRCQLRANACIAASRDRS
jgi:hypothetical protein